MRIGTLYVAGRFLLLDTITILFRRRADGRSRSIAGSWRGLATYADCLRARWRGRVAASTVLAERLLVAHPDLRWPLRIVIGGRSGRGELTASLDATRRLRHLADSPALRRRETDLASRLQELGPTWLPTIDGDVGAYPPAAPDRVMHLLKASLPDRQSGFTIRSRQTLQAQVGAGLQPFVVTPYGYPARPGDAVPEVELVDGIAHHRLAPGAPTAGLTGTEMLSKTATLAAAVMMRERPAIIHAASGHRGYEYALVGAALRARLGRPLVYEVRGFLESSWTSDWEDPAMVDRAELTRLRSATEDRVMAMADGITTLGEAMRDELIARGVAADKIVVVPNGIDPSAFEPTAADPTLRARYGLGDRWVFGYISNMDHVREGHEVLIDATERLVAAGRPVACLLVGDGTLRPKLEARVARSGLGASVVFTGRVPHDEVKAHYALLDAFVIARQPDRAARFVTPLKPYEAMAMSLPLVVSDLPALTEIADPDRRGLAFPAGDAAALASTLERLIDHPDHARQLGATARAWVLAERTWAANGPRYRDLYAAILERWDPAAVAAGASRA